MSSMRSLNASRDSPSKSATATMPRTSNSSSASMTACAASASTVETATSAYVRFTATVHMASVRSKTVCAPHAKSMRLPSRASSVLL